MFRGAAAGLAAAALLLPCAVVGQLAGLDASELFGLEREFENLVHSGHQPRHHFHSHYRHYHPHLRHRKRASLFEGPASTVAGAVKIPAPPPQSEAVHLAGEKQRSPKAEELLPGRHPSVARKLETMDQAMRDLTKRKQAAAVSRDTLEGEVEKAVLHMNEAVGIKRELARTELHLRAEGRKLRRLEDDRLRLDRTHDHLVSSLHHIMEPKIQFAEATLKHRQHVYHNSETTADKWKEKEEQLHAASLASIEERRDDTAQLDRVNEEMRKVRVERDSVKKRLGNAKHAVAYNVEGYRYAQTRARAADSTMKRAKEATEEAEASVKRLTGILNMEQRRVDESMAVGKDRVQGRIRELESKRKKSSGKIARLSKDYSSWQERERTWARRVAARKQLTHDTSWDYAERQRAVLEAAQAKVAYDAENDSDWAWNEWNSESGKSDRDAVRVDAQAPAPQ